MEHPTPAKLYRDAVRSLFRDAPEPAGSDDAAFLHFLDAEHRVCQANLAEAPEDENERVSRFIIATGLLAFGRLDVIEPVLSPPALSGAIARLALAPWALLPLPDDLRASRDTARLRDWLAANADRLTFRDDLGRFVLADESG